MPVQYRNFYYKMLGDATEREKEKAKGSSGEHEAIPQPRMGPPKEVQSMMIGSKRK